MWNEMTQRTAKKVLRAKDNSNINILCLWKYSQTDDIRIGFEIRQCNETV